MIFGLFCFAFCWGVVGLVLAGLLVVGLVVAFERWLDQLGRPPKRKPRKPTADDFWSEVW